MNILGRTMQTLPQTPIQTLVRITQKMCSDTATSEDLKQLNKLAEKQNDVGKLALAFLEMSQVVIERQAHLSEELATLQEAQSSTQQASELELAYYKALQRKSAWIRQRAADSTALDGSTLDSTVLDDATFQ